MIRRLLAWFLAWVFASPLLRLEARAATIGTLTLQQIEGPEHLYWTAQLRAGRGGGGHRYAWTAQGDSLIEAVEAVLEQAKDWKIGARPAMEHAPKLGVQRFDDDN